MKINRHEDKRYLNLNTQSIQDIFFISHWFTKEKLRRNKSKLQEFKKKKIKYIQYLAIEINFKITL